MKGFFVTGTDTGVGKTIISAGLASVFAANKIDIGVFKPMLSGVERENPESDTSILKNYSNTPLLLQEITPFAFKEPVTPSVAAKEEDTNVSMEEILMHWESIREKHDYFIVEGAGGIAVPLGESYVVSDVVKALELPIILVARPNLGTINHTFLTVKYAESLGIPVTGIILNGYEKEIGLAERTNPAIIEEMTGVPIIGRTPSLGDLNKESVKQMISEHVDITYLMKQLKDHSKLRKEENQV